MKKLALLVLLLAAVAVAWALSSTDPDVRPAPPPTADPAAAGATPPASAIAAPTPEPDRGDERIRVSPPVHEAVAQGVRGVVVDDRNQAVGGVGVFLLESVRNEPLTRVLTLRDVPFPPVAQTSTGPDGSFELGLPQASERVHELRLLAQGFADQRLAEVRVLKGEWLDAGTIVLQRGTVLRGRVLREGTSLPIAQAEVVIESGYAFDDLMHRTLPGRERGLVTATDNAGSYRFDNAPAHGLLAVSAVAPGFARVTKNHVETTPGQPVELDFELPRGLQIRGLVAGTDGRPIEDARVEAWPLQGDGTPLQAQTAADGSFAIAGLRAVDHRLRVLPRQHRPAELAAVAAGTEDVRITVLPRASASVAVRTREGAIVRSYLLSLRRWFPENGGQIGAIADAAEQTVRLGPDEDRTVVHNLDRGDYVVQVQADGWAKTLSAPFTIEDASREVSVDVTLSAGATLAGTILDEGGQPVAGARVATQVDGADEDNPVWRMIASMTPDKVTRATATTDARGAFALPRLAAADYQIQIDHPGHCRLTHRGVRLAGEGEQRLPPLVLRRGALVSGLAFVDGQPRPQVRVTIATAGAADGSTAQDLVRLEAVSDNAGRFTTARRLPPGSYELRATTTAANDPQADILRQLMQLQRSAVTFTVGAGQDLVEQDIRITTDH